MSNMKSQIIIFEGNQKDGIFSRNKKFYPKDYTSEDIYNSIKRDKLPLGINTIFQD